MEKITFWELRDKMMKYNDEHGIYHCCGNKDIKPLRGVIVYKQSNFSKEYTEQERSYEVISTNGKAFSSGMFSNSIWGDSLDGSDKGVRLDCYNWDIDYCYLLDEVE